MTSLLSVNEQTVIASRQRIQLVITQEFDFDQIVVGFSDGIDKFIEFEMQSMGVAVLRILYQKNHQKSDDCRGRVDYEFPGIGKMKVGSYRSPKNHETAGNEESPRLAHAGRRF